MQVAREQLEHHKLFAALENGATVLTANNRLARAIKDNFDREKREQGELVWPSIKVLPIEIWLQELLADLRAAGLVTLSLPGSAQQLLIWENILTSAENTHDFLNISAMSGSVQQAWSIAQAYDFSKVSFSGPVSLDQKQFMHWSDAFAGFCEKNGVIDQAGLTSFILQNDLLDYSVLPGHIVLAGFYELTPVQSRLFEALSQRSVMISELKKRRPTSASLVRTSPPDDQAELEMAAAWLRSTLEKNPQARIAVVIPDLQARKIEFEYQLKKHFYPGFRPDQIRHADCPWNFSLGVPLTTCPVTETAMLLLILRGMALESNELTRLLLSPFIAKGDSELDQRSAIDAKESVRRRLKTGLDDLCNKILGPRTPGFKRALISFGKIDISGTHVPSYWAQVFAKLLDTAGWPGERTLNSDEYQQVESVRDAVSGLVQMDTVSKGLTFSEAEALLRKILGRTVYQSQTRDVPVQILGVLEVTGLSFDMAWVCEMDNDRWPQTGTPNPFLPLSWQREVGAPHASAERELAFSNFLISELSSLAQDVTFSHVAMRDENELQAAMAIAELPLVDKSELLSIPEKHGPVTLQILDDSVGTPVDAGQVVKGGTGLLAAQASCPFKAFAAYRLKATEIERPQMGIDPRDRGNLIHEVLEKFWEQTKCSDDLLKIPVEKIREIIEALAKDIISSDDFLLHDYQTRLTQLELDRLISVAVKWLEFEKQRQVFTIDAVEQKRDFDFEGLPIRLTIDRIDTVYNNDGTESKVIIDYKSGFNHDPADWMLERPGEPQLPLYAMTEEGSASAISFALMNNEAQEFKGFANSEDLLPGVGFPYVKDPENSRKKISLPWDEAIDHWRSNLGKLSAEIRNGYAAVLPENGACTYCKLSPFCRINDIREEVE